MRHVISNLVFPFLQFLDSLSLTLESKSLRRFVKTWLQAPAVQEMVALLRQTFCLWLSKATPSLMREEAIKQEQRTGQLGQSALAGGPSSQRSWSPLIPGSHVFGSQPSPELQKSRGSLSNQTSLPQSGSQRISFRKSLLAFSKHSLIFFTYFVCVCVFVSHKLLICREAGLQPKNY